MARATVLSEPDLEIALLRKSVGRLTAGRHCCEECGRTPLVGERIYVFARSMIVCALCRPRRRGEPERTELVRHSERGHTVRLRRRAA